MARCDLSFSFGKMGQNRQRLAIANLFLLLSFSSLSQRRDSALGPPVFLAGEMRKTRLSFECRSSSALSASGRLVVAFFRNNSRSDAAWQAGASRRRAASPRDFPLFAILSRGACRQAAAALRETADQPILSLFVLERCEIGDLAVFLDLFFFRPSLRQAPRVTFFP